MPGELFFLELSALIGALALQLCVVDVQLGFWKESVLGAHTESYKE